METIGEQVADGGDYSREFRRVWAAIDALRNARTLPFSSIGSDGLAVHGGTITIDRQGRIEVIADDGSVLVNLGALVKFGETSQGWALNFKGGEPAIALGGAEDAQTWQLWDNAGHYIITNDSDTGVGLARPYLAYHMTATDDAEPGPTYLWPSTTSSTPVAVLGGVNSIWHPTVTIGVGTPTDGGGTGHWRLKFNDTVVISDETGYGVHEVDVPGWGTEIVPGEQVAILVEAWVADGATRVYANADRCFGRQSPG